MEITITALTKTYAGGVFALNDLSLTIPNGMFGLLGPNGAGKTTLMRILAGILRPSSGSIHMGEFDATTNHGRAAIKPLLGYVPQDLGLYPDLSAEEFLHYIALMKGLHDRVSRRQRVQQLLEMVALSHVAKRGLKTFSGGMKRRVGIAQALLNDPQLLIVDEPTAGLDPEERIRFRNLLVDLGNARTVLLSTHIVEDIAQTCPRLAVMKNGQVIFAGTSADLVTVSRGNVWTIAGTAGQSPENVIVVSTLNTGQAINYRVVGTPAPGVVATPVEPTLEDGYVCLMHKPVNQATPSQKKHVHSTGHMPL